MTDERVELRRSEDRDRALNVRLDQLERAYQTLTSTVTQLESTVNVVKLEQSHLKELFEARLRIIEKNQEIQIAKFDALAMDMVSMASDIDKTPAGRSVLGQIKILQDSFDEQSELLRTNASNHLSIERWKDGVEGVLAVLKWIGAGGLIALGISILRMLKLLP